jgi:hypothetical protein
LTNAHVVHKDSNLRVRILRDGVARWCSAEVLYQSSGVPDIAVVKALQPSLFACPAFIASSVADYHGVVLSFAN